MKAETIVSLMIVPLVWIVYLLLKDKIEKSEAVTLRETNFLRTELQFLNQKQINLLETFVNKFASWENKLKDVVSDINEGKDPSQSLECFEGESERLRDYFSTSIDLVKNEMKRLEKVVRTRENKSIHGNGDLTSTIEREISHQKDLIAKFHEILRSMNFKNKSLERMIGLNQRKIAALEKNVSFGKISIK